MLKLLVYTKSFMGIDDYLFVATRLHHVFGVSVHFLHRYKTDEQTVEMPINLNSRYIKQAPEDMNISEHRISKANRDIVRCYAEGIKAEMMITQIARYPEDGNTNIQILYQTAKELGLPVLLLKKGFEKLNPKHVLLIANAEYFGKGVQINALKKFVDSQKGKIHLLHILQKKEMEDIATEQMKFFAKEHHIYPASFHLINHKNLEKSLTKLCQEMPIDLICIRTHGNQNMGKLFLEHSDINFLLNSKIPLLTFHLKHYD